MLLPRQARVGLGRELFQGLRHLHRIGCAARARPQRLRQPRQLALRAVADVGERRRRIDPTTVAHDEPQQRLARMVVALETENVARHAAVGAVAAPDLLAAGPSDFAERPLAARETGIFLQLVGAIERRNIRGCGQAGADPEAVDRRVRAQHRVDRVLVEAAAREDGHIGEPALVENSSHLLGQRDQIAAVETHGAHRDARSF